MTEKEEFIKVDVENLTGEDIDEMREIEIEYIGREEKEAAKREAERKAAEQNGGTYVNKESVRKDSDFSGNSYGKSSTEAQNQSSGEKGAANGYFNADDTENEAEEVVDEPRPSLSLNRTTIDALVLIAGLIVGFLCRLDFPVFETVKEVAMGTSTIYIVLLALMSFIALPVSLWRGSFALVAGRRLRKRFVPGLVSKFAFLTAFCGVIWGIGAGLLAGVAVPFSAMEKMMFFNTLIPTSFFLPGIFLMVLCFWAVLGGVAMGNPSHGKLFLHGDKFGAAWNNAGEGPVSVKDFGFYEPEKDYSAGDAFEAVHGDALYRIVERMNQLLLFFSPLAVFTSAITVVGIFGGYALLILLVLAVLMILAVGSYTVIVNLLLLKRCGSYCPAQFMHFFREVIIKGFTSGSAAASGREMLHNFDRMGIKKWIGEAVTVMFAESGSIGTSIYLGLALAFMVYTFTFASSGAGLYFLLAAVCLLFTVGGGGYAGKAFYLVLGACVMSASFPIALLFLFILERLASSLRGAANTVSAGTAAYLADRMG